MGWFGSLQLAYKYAIALGSLFAIVIVAGMIKVYFNKRRLKKFTKKAEEDAAGVGVDEERVELNKRELDEGDLFGIRAIQSGYFGGVAQSRPSSVAEDRSDRDSMASNTLLGSHQSPDRKGHSPMSSVLTLPLEARTSSPLRRTAISAADPDQIQTSRRQPSRSLLQPSDAQISGSVTHDPAVNMYLNVPPSPGATSRPSSAGSDSRSRSSSGGSLEPEQPPERSPESSSFPSNSQHPSNSQYRSNSEYPTNSQYNGHYIPTAAPQLPQAGENRNSARPVSSQHPVHEIESQHASIISRESDATIRDNNRSIRSSIQEETDFSAMPMKSRTSSMGRTRSSIQEEQEFTVMPNSRPNSSYRPYTTRTSMYGNQPPGPSGTSPPRNNEDLPASHHPIPQPSSDNDHELHTPQNTNRMHTSHLSDASSVYSTSQRQSIGPEASMNPRAQFSRTSTGRGYPQGLSTIPPSHDLHETPIAPPTYTPQGTRRGSDASSHQPPSNIQSASNSHRNTREFGDFYDSYWRHSGHSVGTGDGGIKEGRTEEKSKEGRRQDRLEIDVPTINEVETPVASPAAPGRVGTAK